MLIKLLKKDFQATSRYFIPLIIGFIIISIFSKILFEVGIVSSTDSNFILTMALILFLLYIICIVAFFILTYVIIVGDFYKTMVSEQAYLTHTLPVKTSTLLNSKMIVSIVWQILVSILILLSCILFVLGHINDINPDFIIEFEMAMGMSIPAYLLLIAVSVFLSSCFSPLLYFVSIALGHLFGKHRILGAILCYIGIYSVLQVISTIMLISSGYFLSNSVSMGTSFDTVGDILSTVMWPSVILTLITGIAFYVLTYYIFHKKLNLE